MIEKGQTTPDDLLLDRVERLKVERASCLTALERAKAGRESVTPIDHAKLRAFAELISCAIDRGRRSVWESYLSRSSSASRVGHEDIRIFGQKTVLEQLAPAEVPARVFAVLYVNAPRRE